MKGLDYTAPSPNRENKYQYNGKEKQTELGLNHYDYSARNYDVQILRTTTLDPHADSYHSVSAYSFLNNNPLRFIDPTGMDVTETANGTSYTGFDAQRAFMQLKFLSAVNKKEKEGNKDDDLTVDKLRELGKQNGVTDLFKIGDVFEKAFFEAVGSAILYNDTKERRESGEAILYESKVRKARVRPDGIGAAAYEDNEGTKAIDKKGAFYEVKSGQTTLDANYSTDNPQQLLAMLEVLSRKPATAFGGSTLFLVTPAGVKVDLTNEAIKYGVNLIQITPTLLNDGSISFSNAKIYYANPRGRLGQNYMNGPPVRINMEMFNKPVKLKWN
jgi:RHS repeat-associated protein